MTNKKFESVDAAKYLGVSISKDPSWNTHINNISSSANRTVGDVPRSTSYGVYISQLIRFARASSYVAYFNTHNKLLTQKLLKQGYRYHKLRKTFSKF